MITILKDEEYRVALLEQIRKAEKEILIATYKCDYKDSLSTRHLNAIIEALARAMERKVKVYTMLNMDRENSSIGRINKRSGALLKKRGVITRNSPIGRTYHAKIVIIDGVVAFIGSHNISEASLCRNFEISLMISPDHYKWQGTDGPLGTVQDLRQIYLKEWEKGR